MDLTYSNCTKRFDTVLHVKPATIITEVSRKTVHQQGEAQRQGYTGSAESRIIRGRLFAKFTQN